MNKEMNVVYFSPTGNTRKVVETMAYALHDTVKTIDLTCSFREGIKAFDINDFVIFGMPVYGGRIPAIAKQRLNCIKGKATPCIIVVSYGNRDYDDALLELSDFVIERGFIVKGAAAVIGRHTYGNIQITRPDEMDVMQYKEFAKKVAVKPDNGSKLTISGSRPYKAGGLGGAFRPLTSSYCIRCGKCVKECPVQAIAEDFSTISTACLSCFHCIRFCPVHAKHMDTENYIKFSEMFTKKLAERKENEYFI